MADDIYRQLQKRLDLYSLGFPATESGVEIKLLKKLFNENDARIFLMMSPKLETPSDVAPRLEKTVEETAGLLEDMASSGLLFRLKKEDISKYGAIPFMHGLMEFQINRIDMEFIALLEQYFHEGFHQAIAAVDGMFLRTIPVQRSLEPGHHVAAFEDAGGILKNAGTIAVAECMCRKEKNMKDEGCGKPVETCFMFGSMAKYYIDNKIGRQVNLDEAMSILEECREAGLVTQPGTAQNPAGMCSCCGDCCGVLAAIKKNPKPADHVFSNYQASIDQNACTGCEACLDRCQMEAVIMSPDNTAQIDYDRCIGCGLCVTSCPADCITLTEKKDQPRRIPPEMSSGQMMTIAKNRGII